MGTNILIVGCGTVGSNIKAILKKFQPDCVDKFKPDVTNYNPGKKYDIAYICVDTPMNEKGICDRSEVLNAVLDNNAEIFVIKSTVLPGTTDEIKAKTGKRVVFSPEFYGGTQHCNNFDFDFTILGGDKKDCVEVQQMLQNVFDARHKFKITDAKTAELAKYMENCYLAMKVTFCNEFFRIAEKSGVCYEELRELVTLDPRIDPSHTFVYRDHPFWQSHCLDKDVQAIAEWSGSEFLKSTIGANEKHKKDGYGKDAK